MKTSSPSIDLMFTSQPNLLIESDVHSLLHENCHHQIALDIVAECCLRPTLLKRDQAIQIIVHYEILNCDDRDLPWITKIVKQAIETNRIHRNLAKFKSSGMGNNVSDFERFDTLHNKLNSLIAESKQKNYAKIATKLVTCKNVNLESLLYFGKIIL